jgi:hypothetical protein
MRPHRTILKHCFRLMLGTAAFGVATFPVLALAQGYSTGGMRAPSVNMGSISPRAPEFRTPRVYSTQSFSAPEGKPRLKPKTRSLKPDENKTAEPTGQAAQRRSAGAPPANERRFLPNEVIIEVDGRPSTQAADALARRHRLTRVQSQTFELTQTTLFRWTIPDGRSVRQVIRSLEADREIRSAQPNYQYQLQQNAQPYGDPAQYALGKLRLPEAHAVTRGDRILVAVIDSGIDASHPELAGVIADTFDPIGGSGEPHTHGTGIAGTIAAHSRLMGVAPGAKILAVRAFDSSGSGAQGTTFSILRGLEWAVSKGARVINMSFAGPQDPALSRALAGAHKKGVALIAAAGNGGPKSPPLYPAADPNVIAVTATDAEDKLFHAANRGNHVAVSAPGVDILVPAPGAGYQVTSGTSFAAAHVSGIAALVLERDPELSPDGLRRVLLSSARDLGPKGRDKDFGMGLADAYRAVVTADGRPNEAISSNDAGVR